MFHRSNQPNPDTNPEVTDRSRVFLDVTDEELEQLPIADAKALFAQSEALGYGDFELTRLCKGDSGSNFVDSYEVATPEWSPEFLQQVKEASVGFTEADVANLMTDLRDLPIQQPFEQEERPKNLAHRMHGVLRSIIEG